MAIRVSPKTLKIMCLFLIPPFLIGIGWLSIPLGIEATLIVAISIYHCLMFFAWLTFYDFIWPNCGKKHLFFGTILFLTLSACCWVLIWARGWWRSKFQLSILSAAEFISSGLIYLVHVLQVKKQLKQQNERLKLAVSDEDRFHMRMTGPQIYRHWSRTFYQFFCYLPGLDGLEAESVYANSLALQAQSSLSIHLPTDSVIYPDEADDRHMEEGRVEKTEEVDATTLDDIDKMEMNCVRRGSVGSTNTSSSMPGIIMGYQGSNLHSNMERQRKYSLFGDSDSYIVRGSPIIEKRKESSPARRPERDSVQGVTVYIKEGVGEAQWSNKTLIVAFSFKIIFIGTWYYLQGECYLFEIDSDVVGFYLLARKWKDEGENPDDYLLKVISKAIAAVIIFHATRVLITNVTMILNTHLPKFLESCYFSQFAIQTIFFFYYRNIFVTVSDWKTAVIVNFISYAAQVIMFPLCMWEMVYQLRFKKLHWLITEKFPALSFLSFLCDQNMEYSEYVKALVVEYYYCCVADYYSLLCVTIFAVLLRFAAKYNLSYYPNFNNLSEDQFLQLIYRYLFLFGFDLVGDIIIRYATKRLIYIDISHDGRSATIMNYKTRYMFTIFLIYFVMDAYYSLTI
ncbi:hypothetical protein PROFUN_07078 [Planoprotostelium fungivorum]|uniref:Uncharacterized protein n=1 Tax=Planoprotostelium fungivorum TaxID=1890364 RepID=A0A2P6NN25_9EUKA|nr:hypothetical protein PROFUN_07078 [Planoprotostelium fungivorum]